MSQSITAPSISRRSFVAGAAGAVVAVGTVRLADGRVVTRAQAQEMESSAQGDAASSADTSDVFSVRAASPTCTLPDPMPNGCVRAGTAPIDPVDAPDEYDEVYDVVVAGAGGAGFTAALTIAERGHNVLLLEKNGYVGGDTQFTLGIYARNTPWQMEVGDAMVAQSNGALTENPFVYTDAREYLCLRPNAVAADGAKLYRDSSHLMAAYCPSPTFGRDIHVCATIMDLNPEVMNWLIEHGVAESHGAIGGMFPGAGMCPCDPAVQGQEDDWLSYAPYCGYGYFKDGLTPYAAELGMEVRLESPVTRLIWDGARVTGVVYTDKAGVEHTVGAKAVCLATGGFAANQDMIDKYVEPRRAAAVRTWSQPGATGDGIRIAQGLGAATRGMSEIEIWDGGVFRSMGPVGGYTAPNQLVRQKSLSVNKVAKRYCNEAYYSGYFYSFNGAQTITQPDMTTFTLFDSTMISRADLIEKFKGEFCEYPLANFDEELPKYIEMGVVKKADTIAELAEQLGLDPARLEETVERYNEMCANQWDSDFFKDPEFLWPISEPPFYGVEQYGGTCFATWGGLVIDDTTRVLDEAWEPIAGLYACGEQTFGGSSGGQVFPAGRLAGKVLAEKLETGEFDDVVLTAKAGGTPTPAEVVPSSVTYVDGTYSEEATGILGAIPVTVTIEGGAITDIAIGENSETPGVGGYAIEKARADVLAANGVEGVSSLSGATITSNAVLNAIAACLDQASA